MVPLALVIVAVAILANALARTRQSWQRAVASSRPAVDITLAASVVSILTLTLSPPVGRSLGSTIIFPFSEFRHADPSEVIAQLVGNVILFVPLGFLAPLRWSRLDSGLWILVASAAFSFILEGVQGRLLVGRQASVTDVVLNVIGAALGYAVMRAVRALARRTPTEMRTTVPS
jgi:glycopeptide antibiotics resistance protein